MGGARSRCTRPPTSLTGTTWPTRWRVQFGDASLSGVRATHAVFMVAAAAEDVQEWLRATRPELTLMSAGQTIEIFKEAGLPTEFVRRFDLASIDGSHALGHTRMATESRVTTEHSHPFSTGLDLCLVHNGSLSNHNRLRRSLRKEGIHFQTDNDSRGRRRLPHLAHARRERRWSRRSRDAWTTSTGSTPSRWGPPTASPCCATRSRASRR